MSSRYHFLPYESRFTPLCLTLHHSTCSVIHCHYHAPFHVLRHTFTISIFFHFTPHLHLLSFIVNTCLQLQLTTHTFSPSIYNSFYHNNTLLFTVSFNCQLLSLLPFLSDSFTRLLTTLYYLPQSLRHL